MTPLPTPANCPDPTGSASGETPLEESSVNLRQLWTNSCPTIELTPGEYLDRLAIADVKVKKCSPANYRRAIEQSAQLFSLAHAVRCNTVAFEALTRHLSELMVVHTRLWDVENEIRELDKIVHQTYDGKLRDWDRVLWHRISDEASNALVRYRAARPAIRSAMRESATALAMERLRETPVARIHSRKLRSFEETAFL